MLATLPLDMRSEPVTSTRFTLDGSDALEEHLANICEKVSTGCRHIISPHKLEGVALGGGYGRGEGGVLKTPSGDQPYNDLEFYVFVRGSSWLNERRHAKALHEVNLELAPAAGVELEFKITSLDKLRRSPLNLFHHDLLMGHRWVTGGKNLFAGCEHHQRADKLPLSEATRLLMNRCSGLLFAREKLGQDSFTNEDADFVQRNLAKTELALGDALLIAFGKYHWSCLVRGQRLDALNPEQNLPWLGEVKKRHSAGIEFKLQPSKPRLSRPALENQFRAVSSLAFEVWLWLETFRLDETFESAIAYASSPTNKWPGGSRWRNRLANVKVFGPRAGLISRNNRHPRGRILNALALLLWAPFATSACLEQKIRRELLAPEQAEIVAAYRERWRLTS